MYRTIIIHCSIVFSDCDCDEDDGDPCGDNGKCYCETGSSDAMCCCGTGHTGDTCGDPGKCGDIYIILHLYHRYQ